MPAQLPFKEIAETVDILAVGQFCNVRIKNNRGKCPVCNTGSDNSLEFLPETNSFRCHAAPPPPGRKVLAGDCIALYAHLQNYTGMYRAAKELHAQFCGSSPATPPKNEKGRENAPKTFDPAAFLEKLEFTEDVAALGITEEQARALGIGEYRGKVYCAIRYQSGTIAGFLHVAAGKMILPKTLLADQVRNVVPFQKRA